MTRFVESFADGSVRVAGLDMPGTDPQAIPTIYLHGLGASSSDIFRDIMSQPSFRAARSLLIDLPGFGDSTAPEDWSFSMEEQANTVTRLLDRLQLSQVAIVGHSMGGSIAIALAWQHPELVSRLVVAEPNLDPGVGNLSAHIARQPEERFVNRGYAALVYQTQRQAERGDHVASRFLTTLKQASPVVLHRCAVSLLAIRDPTFREMLVSLTMPRAVIAGDRTPPVDPPLAGSSIDYYVIENAGHVMMIDNPEGFARALHKALK